MSSVLTTSDNVLMSNLLCEQLTTRGYRATYCSSEQFQNLSLVRQLQPGLVIFNSCTDWTRAISLLDRLEQQRLCDKVMILADRPSLTVANIARQCSLVRGALTTQVSMAELFFCLQELVAGHTYYSSAINNYASTVSECLPARPDLSCLSSRERQVIHLIAQGRTNKQIGHLLCISEHTVNNHRARMTKKLQLQGSNRLLALAIRMKDQL